MSEESRRSFLITGKTYPARSLLKKLGARWAPEREGWVLPLNQAAADEVAAEFSGLQISVIEADAARRPPALLVSGNTYPARFELRDLGGRWYGGKKVWIVPREHEAEVQRLAGELPGLGYRVIGEDPPPPLEPTRSAEAIPVSEPVAPESDDSLQLSDRFVDVAVDVVGAEPAPDGALGGEQLVDAAPLASYLAPAPTERGPELEEDTSRHAAAPSSLQTGAERVEAGRIETPASTHVAASSEEGSRSDRPADEAQPAPSSDRMRRLIAALSATLEDPVVRITNPALTRMATAAFGGTRGEGAYTSKDAYDAMEAAVNRWVLRNGPRLLAGDPATSLGELRELLQRLPRQSDRTMEQVEWQQFSTPPTHGFVAAVALGIRSHDVVLEPSAGVGGLAAWARAAGAQAVHVNEIAPRRVELLKELGFAPTTVNAEVLNDVLPDDIRPTLILMNPPFSATAGRVIAHRTEFGVRHVQQALVRLAEGGRLVAIVGEGMALDRPRMSKWWKETAQRYNVRCNLELPGEEYGRYGTTFGNCLVVVDKSGPTPGVNWSRQLDSIRWGRVASLEEALDAVRNVGRNDRTVESAPRPALGADRDDHERGNGDESASAHRRGRGDGHRSRRDLESTGPRERPAKARPVQAAEPAAATVPSVEVRPVRGGGGPAEDVPGVEAPRAAEPTAEVEQVSGTVVREEEDGGTFVRYAPARLRTENLFKHPADIVEAASMAAVMPPEITYRSALPQSLLTEGRLSDIQYESVLYAGQRHAQTLPGGERAGYFVGDGTGVGKGRIVAAIILDNWLQGRQRAVWFSVSNDLMEAAIRDLKDTGGHEIPITRVNEYATGGAIEQDKGVIFATYQSLIATSRSEGTAGRSRREQIEEWLGKDGVIVYDEAHKAKNALAADRGEPTQTGLAVVGLQEKLPAARVVYVSATGATDVRHMAYMTRLGLWGPSTAFPGGFSEFLSEIDAGGVGAMELVARDLKALGMYNSRSISFRGVDYREVVHELTPEQRDMYNTAAEAWQLVLGNMDAALDLTNSNAMARRNAMTRFWGDQQRFFRNLITALKVPSCIRETEASLAAGRSVVIGLIGTGESKTASKVAQAVAQGAELDSLDFTPREVICDMVRRAFPVEMYTEVTDKATKQTTRVKLRDDDGNPIVSKEAVAMRETLLERLSCISLPENPLDQLVNHFGPDAVAELTGRKRRLVRDPKTGVTGYVKRVPEGVPMNRVNLYEMECFQEGRKRIAVISDAASTGISLHASNRGGNQERRVHITLELGWSADKQMQTFGRTHRSDQASSPEYILLSTNVGGERRFSSTIARRLASLGALTKGQRDATGGGGLAQHNFESQEGQAALQAFYSHILRGGEIAGLEAPIKALGAMGLFRNSQEAISDMEMRDVPHFLNRLLALDVDRQNALFAEFSATFDRTIENARASGTFDAGVEDIRGIAIRLGKDPEAVHRDQTTGAETHHFELHVDVKTTPVHWDDVYKQYGRLGDCSFSGFYEQGKSSRLVFATPWSNRTDVTGRVIPTVLLQTPKSSRHEVLEKPAFLEKFVPVKVADAKPRWEEQVRAIPPIETQHVHIIGGAILPLWARLKTSEAQQLRVVRATAQDGRRVVGIQIPEAHVARTLQAVGVTRSLRTPEEVFRAVGREGESVQLTAGLWIKATKVHSEPRMEITGLDYYKFDLMRSIGMIEEWLDWKKRFFVPTDERKGLEALEKLLAQYPVIATVTKEPALPGGLGAAIPPAMKGDARSHRQR